MMQTLLRTSYPLTLLVVFGILFFTNLGKPVVIDYHEAAAAEVSREMFLAHDLFHPTLNGEDFLEKPPLLYWLQMLGYDLFGTSAFGARFFNTICGLLTIMVLYLGARKPLGDRTAFYAAMILGSSMIFVGLSRIAMTDMTPTLLLTLCITSLWYGIESALQQRDGAKSILFGCLCAGLTMLARDTISAFLPLLALIIYLLSIRRPELLIRPRWLLPGTLILILVGFSWYLLLGIIHPGGFSFIRDLFIQHHFTRFAGSSGDNAGPVYFYLIVLLVGFLPWSAYLPHAVCLAPVTNRNHAADRFLRLFAIYSGLALVSFFLSGTRSPGTILPVLPGLSLLLATLFNSQEAPQSFLWRLAGWTAALMVGLLGLACGAFPLIFPYLDEVLAAEALAIPILAEPVDLGIVPWATAGLLLFCTVLIFRVKEGHSRHVVCETLLLCSLIVSGSLSHLILPLYDHLLDAPLTRVAKQTAAMTELGDAIVLYGVTDRPSINFSSNRRTVYRSREDLQGLTALFAEPHRSVGITTAYYFQYLQHNGIDAIALARDGGFVLFQVPAGQSPPSPPSTEAKGST